jgi:hypothetical protein
VGPHPVPHCPVYPSSRRNSAGQHAGHGLFIVLSVFLSDLTVRRRLSIDPGGGLFIVLSVSLPIRLGRCGAVKPSTRAAASSSSCLSVCLPGATASTRAQVLRSTARPGSGGVRRGQPPRCWATPCATPAPAPSWCTPATVGEDRWQEQLLSTLFCRPRQTWSHFFAGTAHPKPSHSRPRPPEVLAPSPQSCFTYRLWCQRRSCPAVLQEN